MQIAKTVWNEKNKIEDITVWFQNTELCKSIVLVLDKSAKDIQYKKETFQQMVLGKPQTYTLKIDLSLYVKIN